MNKEVSDLLTAFRDMFLGLARLVMRLLVVSILIIVCLTIYVFFPIQPALYTEGSGWDCDDSALATYMHFTRLGFQCSIIAGNLKNETAKYTESDHVWVWVHFGETALAYDSGFPCFDKVYYRGYEITFDELLLAVEADRMKQGTYKVRPDL